MIKNTDVCKNDGAVLALVVAVLTLVVSTVLQKKIA
jgi:hypothetical protein